MDENKKSSYLQYCDVNNLYGWAILQKFPLNKLIGDTSELNKDVIKNYNEERYFLEVDFQCPKDYTDFIMIYHFYLKK